MSDIHCVECGSLVMGIRTCRGCSGRLCDTCGPDGFCWECEKEIETDAVREMGGDDWLAYEETTGKEIGNK